MNEIKVDIWKLQTGCFSPPQFWTMMALITAVSEACPYSSSYLLTVSSYIALSVSM